MADAAGATVYALFAVGDLPQSRIDQLASEISAAGADRILCSSADALAGPALDATHGPLLASVAERLRPVLFLFPAGGAGTQLGPPLAVRIGAAFLDNASVAIVRHEAAPDPPVERVVLTRWRAARDGQRRVDVGDFERPVVASLPCGLATETLGAAYAEVEMVPCPEPGPRGPRLLTAERDAAATAETCSALLWSTVPLDASARARLPNPLPAGAAVADGAAAALLAAASPVEVFVWSSAPEDTAPPWLLAPGTLLAHVRRETEVPA